MPTTDESKRSRYETLRGELENERSSFIGHWRELGEFIFPRRPRFTLSDVNRGDKRSQKIIDSTATMAARTLRSGMMSGVTSPARPWFKLSTPFPELNDSPAVKTWLHTVTQRMAAVFLKSNLYNVLPIAYGDIGVFGTHALVMEEDFENVVRFYPFPIGSYCLANDHRGKVGVFTREFRLTVRQVVGRFCKQDGKGKYDLSNLSQGTRQAWETNRRDQWVDVIHVIQPNDDYRPNTAMPKYKKYASCYYEAGGEDGVFLRESGYDFFPVLAPRWEVNGEDAYGTDCPGMVALGDIKQMQLGERRIMQAIDKMVNPPMIADSTLRREKLSILPGEVSYMPMRDGQGGFRPAHEVQARIDILEQKQQQVRLRVQRAFYEDLFLMLAETDRRDITAREIEERHEEKLLALGPVLEQLNQDLLDPLIDNTFNIMVRQNQVPPAPKELQGMDLKVEYISIMAQAQKLVGLAGVDRFARFAMQMASASPSVLEKVDTDQLLEVVGDLTSIPPGIVRSDEDVAAMREAAAKQQMAQQQAAQMQQMAGVAKDLSQAPTTGDNALAAMLDQAKAGQIAPQ